MITTVNMMVAFVSSRKKIVTNPAITNMITSGLLK